MLCTYLLLDPISREIRYVGKTKLKLNLRLSTHMSEARTKKRESCHRLAWLRSLMRQGLTPLIEKDLDIPPWRDWADFEVERVAYYRSLGCNLVNGTDGGDGPDEYTPASRLRMSLSAKLRVYTPEQIIARSEYGKQQGHANKGSKRTAESREKMAAKKRGRVLSEETKAKMALSQQARRASAEDKVKQDRLAELHRERFRRLREANTAMTTISPFETFNP